MTTPDDGPRKNPFATRYVRPGAIPFLFPAGDGAEPVTLDALLDRLEKKAWRGAIVGPHGSGKSTLLAAIIAALESQKKPLAVYRQREGERHLAKAPRLASLPPRTLVIVDGYEQLSRRARLLLAWRTRRRRLGLLVTSHSPTSLPVLYSTQPSPEMFRRLVRHLGGDSELSQTDIDAALAANPTNLREALFALYDAHERQGQREAGV